MAAHGWHGCLCPRILSAELEAWMGPEKVEPNIFDPPIQADPVLHGACVDVRVHSPQEHTHVQPSRNLTTFGASEYAQEAWSEARNMRPVHFTLEAGPSPCTRPAALKECISRGSLPRSDIRGGFNCSRDGGARHSEPTLLRKPSFYVVPRRATALFTRVITCAMSLRLLNIPQAMHSNWACGSHIPPSAAVGCGSVQSTFAVQTAHVTLFVW